MMYSNFNFLKSLTLLMMVSLTCLLQAVAATPRLTDQGDGYIGMVGDLDQDENLNIGDITILIDCLLKNSSAPRVADVNGDGRLSIADATGLINNVLTDSPRRRLYQAGGIRFYMICVEGGTFQMGGTSEQSSDALFDEYPVHSVTLSDYQIAELEVPQILWFHITGHVPSCFEDQECPVENVSWDDCQLFIQQLNELTGCNFRLPTEAEWEFAARGGNLSMGYKYSGSNDYDEVAWCENNSGDFIHRTGEKKPNELGIYDMSGNVWEWCQDWWDVYSDGSVVNPTGPASGTTRVCRGGCMMSHVRFCRVSCRMDYASNTRRADVGLRLAL